MPHGPNSSERHSNDLWADVATPISRRALMSRGGAAAALLAAGPLLAACGSSDGSTTAESGGDVGGELDLFVWQGYDADVPPRAAWTKKNGVDIKASFISTQQDVVPKIKSPAGQGIDVSFVGVHQIDAFKEVGDVLTPITVEEVPNLANLFPEFTGGEYVDENGDYVAVPWNFGYNGLAYNADAIGNPTSYDVLFEPDLKGRVAVWDDPLVNMQFVAVIHGFDPQKLTQDQLDEMNAWLARLRPQVKLFAPTLGDFITALSNGDVDAVPNGWCATPVFASGDKPIASTIPKEGAIGWVDAMFIPPGADNRATAAAWINLLLGANQVAAQTYDGVAGGAVAKDVPPLLDKQTRDLFPYGDLGSLFAKAPIALGFPIESNEYVTFDEIVAAWEDFKAA